MLVAREGATVRSRDRCSNERSNSRINDPLSRPLSILHLVFQDVMSEYERIKRSCLKRGELWEDPEFPATQASVFYHQTPPFQFQWKRPKVSIFLIQIYPSLAGGRGGEIRSAASAENDSKPREQLRLALVPGERRDEELRNRNENSSQP